MRRLGASGPDHRPEGGVMKHTCRPIGQRVQAAREQAIIRYV
jgi:hypothetical protein